MIEKDIVGLLKNKGYNYLGSDIDIDTGNLQLIFNKDDKEYIITTDTK